MTDTLTILRNKRNTSDTPHLFNEQMNNIEMSEGRAMLSSYPAYMSINLIGVCNAHCQFCYWSENYADKTKITLEDIKKMEWLKNVSVIDLYGGVGEPLLNKDFIHIVYYLKTVNPSQELHVTINGQFLLPPISLSLAGIIDNINISINASTKKTYEKLMAGCSWDRLMDNIESFQLINQKQNKPTKLSFSFVANKENIKELWMLAEIARECGVSAVGVSHFCAGGFRPERKQKRLPETDCLYFSPETFDAEMRKTKTEFARRGIRLGHPPLFSENTTISLGSRSTRSNNNCVAPWKTAFINPDPGGKWISCCCSINAAHMDITPFNADQDFMETWNSDLFQVIRSEVNQTEPTLINCGYCKQCDKSDPLNKNSQLQMMVDATEQFHDMLNIPISSRTQREIDNYKSAMN